MHSFSFWFFNDVPSIHILTFQIKRFSPCNTHNINADPILCCFLKKAVANEDFLPVYQDIIFKGTSNLQIVLVPILNDVCLEEDGEYFSVVATSDTDCVQIVNEEVTIMIDDDDSEFV